MKSMIERDSNFQQYANDFVRSVPENEMAYLITLFTKQASLNMGAEMNPDAIENVFYHIRKEFGYIPVSYVASAFVRGSLGNIGDGKGRLVPKTIYQWMLVISSDYNRAIASAKVRDQQNDVSIAMDLHKYPVGKAINKKIDWYRKGLMKIEDWDKIPLKEVAEIIGRGHDPKVTDFINK